jgi:uncharacterized protein (DUF58 family)
MVRRPTDEDRGEVPDQPSLASRLDGVLHHDFCPWANRYVYWLKQPIGWFVVAAAMSLIVGVFLGAQGFVLCAAIVGVIALGVVWPWLAIRSVRVALRFDRRRTHEGESVAVELQVSNRLPWPIWGLAIEEGFLAAEQPGDERDALAVALARVPGWSVNEYRWEYVPECRGVYPTKIPQVTCGFPFGIWTARRPVSSHGELIVWPRTVRLCAMPPLSGRELSVASLVSRRIGHEGDVLGVRPFRQGDSLRMMHWAQTARHDQLIVCERQATARQAVRVLVDTDLASHFGTGTAHSLEWCIRIAASLCQGFVEHLVPVELEIGPRRHRIIPGEAGLRGGLDLLARYQAQATTAANVAADRSDAAVHGTCCRRKGTLANGTRTIVVTTDLGWRRTPESRSRLRELYVVLAQEGADLAWTSAEQESNSEPWMLVRWNETVLSQLQQQWEKVSNEGWFAVG